MFFLHSSTRCNSLAPNLASGSGGRVCPPITGGSAVRIQLHSSHLASCECIKFGACKGSFWCTLAAMLLSICPRAAAAPELTITSVNVVWMKNSFCEALWVPWKVLYKSKPLLLNKWLYKKPKGHKICYGVSKNNKINKKTKAKLRLWSFHDFPCDLCCLKEHVDL